MKKIFLALGATMMVVAMAAGSIGAGTAFAEGNHNGWGRGVGNATFTTDAKLKIGPVRLASSDEVNENGNEDGGIIATTTASGTVSIHVEKNENEHGNGNANANANANGHANIQARINALQALVKLLEAELAQIEGMFGVGGSTSTSTPSTTQTISNPGVTNISTSTADVTWTTSLGANSKVYVSTSTPVTASNSMVFANGGLVINHDVRLTGLTPNTTYYLLVGSADPITVPPRANLTFTTAATTTADVTAPVISAVTISNVGTSTATIGWTTNELATSKIYVSTSTPVNIAAIASMTDDTLVTNHSLRLTGLNASTTYFVVVGSNDAANNTATSTENSFTTAH